MQHLQNRLQGLQVRVAQGVRLLEANRGLPQDELQAEKCTAVDDKNIKRMRIESRYAKPRLPMPTDDDRVTMLAEQVPSQCACAYMNLDDPQLPVPTEFIAHLGGLGL